MKQAIISELEFSEFHNRIKDEGARIIRCIEISGAEEFKKYSIVWL